jgi:ubiquitin carboxyl-terminal hydrolase L5
LNVDCKLQDDFVEADRKSKLAARQKNQKGKKRRKFEDDDYETENGFHFIAFVPVVDSIWRMDGMEPFPRRVSRSFNHYPS